MVALWRIIGLCLLVTIWEIAVHYTGVKPYILPAPSLIAENIFQHFGELLHHASITGVEIALGFLLGSFIGILLALLLSYSPFLEKLMMPVLLLSQALPVFAVAPLLVIWLGFGLSSKLVMCALIIFFPVAAHFLDGLKRDEHKLLQVAQFYKATSLQKLMLFRLPNALPSLFSGLKVAAALSPIGAIVGEWVGAAGGLGFLMLHANARMQTAQLFSALFMLFALVLMFYFSVNWLLNRLQQKCY